MRAVPYFVSEALASLYRSRRISLLATGTIAIAMFIPGLFLLVAGNLAQAVEGWRGEMQVTVFLADSAGTADLAAIEQALAAAPELSGRTFVSRAEALQRFQSFYRTLRPLASTWEDTPLPASWELQLDRRYLEPARLRPLLARLAALPGVDEVQYDLEWMERLRKIVGLLRISAILLGGLLSIGAAFTIASVVRLTVYLYRDEIEIMRLVGATEAYIRGPFLVEGVLQGIFGGAAAVLLLFVAHRGLLRYLEREGSVLLDALAVSFLTPGTMAALVGAAAFAGLCGSFVSLSRQNA